MLRARPDAGRADWLRAPAWWVGTLPGLSDADH